MRLTILRVVNTLTSYAKRAKTMISLRTILLTLIGLVGTFTAYTVTAAEFPSKQVEYVCDTAPYYYTRSLDDCILEQYGWYADIMDMGLTDSQYANALWYGQKYGYMGDVVGIDFKPVLQRAEYLRNNK